MNHQNSAATSYTITDDAGEDNRILQIAISLASINVFIYDPISKMLRFVDDRVPPVGLPRQLTDPAKKILELDLIPDEFVAPWNQLFDEIHRSADQSNTTLKVRIAPGADEFRWHYIMLSREKDPVSHAVRTVGIVQDVTDRVNSELRYSKEERFRMAMMAENKRVYEINVTRDRFMKLESIGDSTDHDVWRPYDTAMAFLCETCVYHEDWDAFLQVATRNNLLNSFEKGISEFHCEYRSVDEQGELSWSSSTTHLLRDPISGDIKGFIYAKNIDAQKKQELLLRQQVEHDPLTGIYNRTALEQSIKKILANSTPDQLHGFLSIDIDDFKTVNDTFGHVQGDRLLQKVAGEFSHILRDEDILARMGGDEFIVFLTDVSSSEQVLKVAERLRRCVCELCHCESIHCSISVGIAISPRNGSTFEELYQYSDAALYYAKQNGKNCISHTF